MDTRLLEYVEQIRQAAMEAIAFVDGLDGDDFSADLRTQRAVVMSLVIIGEAASKVLSDFAPFAEAHAEIPWRAIRGMRNRIAHGYFDIDLGVVWQTVQRELPDLVEKAGRIIEMERDR